MKKLDRLLITSFIPPFIVTFAIAMFVLLMQTLWLYIDDIAGKGLGFFLVIELLAYKCVSLIPMALPLGMLISSVMVLGNMAEHYELSSFKSAGVPLLRVMRPVMYFGVGAMFFSFLCSNYLIPVSNLKFGSRMYDIQRQKPTLRLDAGIFNDDFGGYAIHIGKKDANDKTIRDVLIYDHSDANKGRLSQIVAKEGEMYTSENGQFFVMNLRDGHQYMETKPSSNEKSYPFVRTTFKSWNKVFDLGEFELNRTNEELFKQNRAMLSINQLGDAIDSIKLKILKREKTLSNHISSYFYYMEADSMFLIKGEKLEPDPFSREMINDIPIIPDTAQVDSNKVNVSPQKKSAARKNRILAEVKSGIVPPKTQVDTSKKQIKKVVSKPKPKKKKSTIRRKSLGTPLTQNIEKDLSEYESISELFKDRDRPRLTNKAKTSARSIHAQSQSAIRSLERMVESRVKHVYELHTKYSMAVVCFIFLFIGAPMGAIVRKGGFGYPILISIIFFVLFVVLTILYKKIAETNALPATLAAWMPSLILFPIGIILTYKAMNDSKLLNTDRYIAFFASIFKSDK